MTSYAAYTHPARPPLLLRDGFSVWAFLFGPLWLLAHAAFIPGLLLLALDVILRVALHGPLATITGLAVAVLIGLHGQDLRGFSLARRGWRLTSVVTAPDAGSAYLRLLAGFPDLHPAASR